MSSTDERHTTEERETALAAEYAKRHPAPLASLASDESIASDGGRS